MRRLLIASICCIAAAGLGSCRSQQPPAGGPRKGKLTIAVIPKGTTHSFWKSVHAGAVKAEKELADVEAIWKGAMREDDLEGQTQVIEGMINRKVNGIVLAPLHYGPALQIKVKEAKSRGIPTVIFDSALGGSDFVSFVSTNNLKGGERGADRMAELAKGLGRKAKIVMMRYYEGSASTGNREKGFLDAARNKYADLMEIVSENQRGGDIEESMKTAEGLMPVLKQADGVFCPNETTTHGMLLALEGAGLAGKIKFVGFDSNAKLVEALRDKKIHGLVLQDPINMGYMAVKTLVAHLRGEKVDAVVDTGSDVATADNMSDPRIQNLLNPDYKKWLGEQ